MTNPDIATLPSVTTAAEFLGRKEFTHLLFVDADIAFPPAAVLRLLEADYDISACAYPKKALRIPKLKENFERYRGQDIDDDRLMAKSLDYNFNLPQNANGQIYLDKGFVKVDHAATGFMMIKRNVFEKWVDTFPDDKYVNDVDGYNNEFSKDNFYTFFDCFISPETKVYLSEDYAFCYKAQTMGYSIWLDMGTALTHCGNMLFKGHVLELLSVSDELAEKQKRLTQQQQQQQQTQHQIKHPTDNGESNKPKAPTKSIPSKANILPPRPAVNTVQVTETKSSDN